MQNFIAIGATSVELLRDKKSTTSTQTYTQYTHTSIHFRETTFFQRKSYIDKVNDKIRQWHFETVSKLYLIKD